MKTNNLSVLMLGPHLKATSGISNVVNNWLEVGIKDQIDLYYISTLRHYVPGRYFVKFMNAVFAYVLFAIKSLGDVDIVHIHLSSHMSFFRKWPIFKWAKFMRIKTVVHIHGSRFEEFYNNADRKVKNMIIDVLDSADAVFVLSNSWKRFVISISNNKNLYIIYNGASLKKYSKKVINKNRIAISFMGRLGKRKGIHDLLDAFERIVTNVPNAHLVLGGDGDVEQVRKRVAMNNLEKRISILGWVSGEQKIRVFRESDIYVLPSYNEGLPGSILEAMAAGTPIISTPVGGISEAVIENRNGYLVTQGNVDDLYGKLLVLCRDNKLRERMGKESQNIIKEKFEIENIVFDLVKIYKNIVFK